MPGMNSESEIGLRPLNIMWMSVAVLVVVSAACIVRPVTADILSKEPYNKVGYLARPASGLGPIDTIEVVGRGYKANILYTIPRLYLRALELANTPTEGDAGDTPVIYVANIRISSYTKRETFPVAYQDCRTESYTEYTSQYNCSGYGSNRHCHTTSVPHLRTRQVCQTRYRQQVSTVLYQKVLANVYDRSEP